MLYMSREISEEIELPQQLNSDPRCLGSTVISHLPMRIGDEMIQYWFFMICDQPPAILLFITALLRELHTDRQLGRLKSSLDAHKQIICNSRRFWAYEQGLLGMDSMTCSWIAVTKTSNFPRRFTGQLTHQYYLNCPKRRDRNRWLKSVTRIQREKGTEKSRGCYL